MFKQLRTYLLQMALLATVAGSLTGCFVYPYGDDGYRHDGGRGHHDRGDRDDRDWHYNRH
jgi:hypothetical protein